jgi:hypothetical protein
LAVLRAYWNRLRLVLRLSYLKKLNKLPALASPKLVVGYKTSLLLKLPMKITPT